jgi:hypothetical protein
MGSTRKEMSRHVAYVTEMINGCTVLIGKPEKRCKLVDVGIDGSILLKFILKGCVDVDLILLGQDRIHGGFCEHGNEHLRSSKDAFIEHLSYC